MQPQYVVVALKVENTISGWLPSGKLVALKRENIQDMKEKLIEKVVVYPGNRIEIVWKFERHLNN